MCRICNNEYQSSNTLKIYNCLHVTIIPNIQNLNTIVILNCPKVYLISVYLELHTLWIEKCPEIITIPNIKKLNTLWIVNCHKLITVPYIQDLSHLRIHNCPNLTNINSQKKEKINQYLSILRITQWYKFWKRQRVLWRIANYYTARKYAPENILKYIKLD